MLLSCTAGDPPPSYPSTLISMFTLLWFDGKLDSTVGARIGRHPLRVAYASVRGLRPLPLVARAQRAESARRSSPAFSAAGLCSFLFLSVLGVRVFECRCCPWVCLFLVVSCVHVCYGSVLWVSTSFVWACVCFLCVGYVSRDVVCFVFVLLCVRALCACLYVCVPVFIFMCPRCAFV